MTYFLMSIFLAITGLVSPSQPAHSLSDVHRIYVDSMGHDDEAARFRTLLKQELTHAGFTVEDDSAKADAALSGAFSVRVLAGYSKAYADLALRASDGTTIWAGKFGPRGFFRGHKGPDDIKNRASDIADKLLKDLKQSSAHS